MVAAAALMDLISILILIRCKMKIRFAGIKDFDRIMSLMINFANAAPVEALHNPKYNYRGVQNLLTMILKSGTIIVGEVDGVIQGMLIAGVDSNPWLPHVKTLKEMAWWVEPEYRNTSLGYRILKEYIRVGKLGQEVGAISNFTITTLMDSPIRDMEKFGWIPIEKNYVYEGK